MSSLPVRKTVLFIAGAMATCLSGAWIQQDHRDGYKDTPIIPGQTWHVHDSDRPYPTEVVPGSKLGNAPSDAVVLFDGKDLSQWTQEKDGQDVPPKWKVVDGCISVVGGTGYLFTKEKFGDCQLHIEWMESPEVTGSGQGRGNSGVFLQDLYEVQVLDSYKSHTYADGQAGALYGQFPPLVNPMTKPGTWQTYDIIFNAAKFDGDKLVEPAYMTVFFNGVLVHNHTKLNGPTNHRVVTPYTPTPPEGRLALQDHGPSHPLLFRNIWLRKLKGYDQP